MEIPTKPCRICGYDLPITSFHKKKTGRYGVDTICKKCVSVTRRAQRENGYTGTIRRDARKRILPGTTKHSARRCDTCDYLKECRIRIQTGFWVKCEFPDLNDLTRISNVYSCVIDKDTVELSNMFDTVMKEAPIYG